MTVSEQLRAALESSGLPMRELAERSGVDESVLSRFRHGAGLRSENLDKLADALGLELRPRSKRAGKQRGQ